MKLEEIYQQKDNSQVGVVLQRANFATEIDIFPNLSPFVEWVPTIGEDSGVTMSELTSRQTEERVSQATRHQTKDDDDDEFQPIPLKRLDSGAHQHNIQGADEDTRTTEVAQARHQALLEDLDKDTTEGARTKTDENGTTGKKEGTLTRILRGIRLDKEKENTQESANRLNPNLSISKLFQRIKPVGKASRESFSKVIHRIGDAIHKKSADEEEGASDKEKVLQMTSSQESGLSEHKKVEEKNFRTCKPETATNTYSN